LTWYREDANGFTFSVRVVPRGSRTEIVGLHDGALKIRVAAPPVDGAANDELVKFLARTLGVSRGAVTLVSGTNARHKTIRIADARAVTRAQLIKLS
jgi:uncharacterized protein